MIKTNKPKAEKSLIDENLIQQQQWLKARRLEKHRHSLVERELLLASKSPVRYVLSLVVLFFLLAYCWCSIARPILVSVLPSPLTHALGLNLSAPLVWSIRLYAMWAVQAFIAALLYPFVIAFVSLLLKKRVESRVMLQVYLSSSGAWVAGMSSLVLTFLFPLFFWGGVFSVWFTQHERIAACFLWFLFNGTLTLRFVLRTYSFLEGHYRQEKIEQYAVSLALPRDIHNIVKAVEGEDPPVSSQVNSVDMLKEFESDVLRCLREGDFHEFDLSFNNLLGLHQALIEASLYKNAQGEACSIATLSFSSRLQYGQLHQYWFESYRAIVDLALSLLPLEARPLKGICTKLPIFNHSRFRNCPPVLYAHFQLFMAHIASALGGWFMGQLNVYQPASSWGMNHKQFLPPPCQAVYREALAGFQAAWCDTSLRFGHICIGLDSAQHAQAKRQIGLIQHYLQESFLMLMSAITRGDQEAAESFADWLLRWNNFFVSGKTQVNLVGVDAVFLPERLLDQEWVQVKPFLQNAYGLGRGNAQDEIILSELFFKTYIQNMWQDYLFLMVHVCLIWSLKQDAVLSSNSLPLHVLSRLLQGERGLNAGHVLRHESMQSVPLSQRLRRATQGLKMPSGLYGENFKVDEHEVLLASVLMLLLYCEHGTSESVMRASTAFLSEKSPQELDEFRSFLTAVSTLIEVKPGVQVLIGMKQPLESLRRVFNWLKKDLGKPSDFDFSLIHARHAVQSFLGCFA